MTDTNRTSDVAELVAMVTGDTLAGRALAIAETDIPAVVVPAGWKVEHLYNEQLLDRPHRKRGTVRFEHPDDFAGYIRTHHTDGTTIWLLPRTDDLSMVAVLDDHADDEPGWGEHRAQLTLRTSTAWQRILTASAAKAMSQREFAELLDDLQDVIVDPAGSDMLQLVDSLEGTATQKVIANNVTGHSVSVTLEAGQTVKSRAGLEIPTKVTVALAPYRHLEYAVRFQLRIRIIVTDGQLVFGLSIVKLEDLIEAAQATLASHIEEALVGEVPVWHGSPRQG